MERKASKQAAQGNEPPLIAVVGPTAVGKTAVGVRLAELLNGEIVSADAVAVYRGLDIGAAKPDANERVRARFHLIDVADPDVDYSVADFERDAMAAIADIRARGKTPILVGGTGLYVRAVTATLTIPSVPPQLDLRARLWAEAEQDGSAVLHKRLTVLDPVSAAKILPGDAKRIIRALEVQSVTGQAISSFHTPEGVRGVPRPNTMLFGLVMEPRAALYERIERRAEAMAAAGLADEVRGLLARGYGPELKSLQSLGYRHMMGYLRGSIAWEETVANLKRDTRRFAKRQISWFGGDSLVRWITLDATEDAEQAASDAADRIAALVRGGGAFACRNPADAPLMARADEL